MDKWIEDLAKEIERAYEDRNIGGRGQESIREEKRVKFLESQGPLPRWQELYRRCEADVNQINQMSQQAKAHEKMRISIAMVDYALFEFEVHGTVPSFLMRVKYLPEGMLPQSAELRCTKHVVVLDGTRSFGTVYPRELLQQNRHDILVMDVDDQRNPCFRTLTEHRIDTARACQHILELCLASSVPQTP